MFLSFIVRNFSLITQKCFVLNLAFLFKFSVWNEKEKWKKSALRQFFKVVCVNKTANELWNLNYCYYYVWGIFYLIKKELEMLTYNLVQLGNNYLYFMYNIIILHYLMIKGNGIVLVWSNFCWLCFTGRNNVLVWNQSLYLGNKTKLFMKYVFSGF